MEKKILIGLDLSFNSTGITITYFEDNQPKIIKFHRIVFDEEKNKTGKVLTPKEIKNINQEVYRMPVNIHVEDIILDSKDKNNHEQIETTLRAMICSKKINMVLAKMLNRFNPDLVICTMENYIMPSFGGPNSLKSVSGLILLQGFVRDFIIRWKLTNPDTRLYLYTPTPSQNKKAFCGNGKAEKKEMIDAFVNLYDGNKLLPNISAGKVDDVIDSFSLMIHGLKIYSGIYA
jgi:Holliday junction resolvasome RuvABC endonuclease subunit